MANTVGLTTLSESTDGKQIKVAATSSPGTLIHTVTGLEKIYLWAYNADTSDIMLTIEWGGTSSDDAKKQLIEFQKSDIFILDGRVLQNGLSIRAYAAVADKIYISGHSYTVTPGS